MVDLLATGMAALAVVLIVAALLALSAGDLGTAGVSFLSASLVIYLRETRALDT